MSLNDEKFRDQYGIFLMRGVTCDELPVNDA